jgi:regulator of replication initiation timing
MMQPEMDTITPAEVRPVRVAACPGLLRDRIGRSIAGAAPARTPIFFDRVEEALAADDQAAVLVPLRMPRAHVAAALTAGADADSALRDWRRQAEAVLTGCRRARRRVVVVDADLFVAGAADGAADAAARLGVDLASASGAHRARDDGTDVHAPLAAALVATDLRVQELFDELEAMATGPVTPCLPDRADVAAALRATMAVAEERDHLRDSLHEAVAEADRLRMEGAGLSRDLEQCDTALAELRQEAAASADALAQSDAARSRLEAELREARGTRDALAEERDLLRDSLREMADEKARLHAEQSALEERLEAERAAAGETPLVRAERDAASRRLEDVRGVARWREAVLGAQLLSVTGRAQSLEADLGAAHAEIARLHASTSWKVTAPLRAARRWFGRA